MVTKGSDNGVQATFARVLIYGPGSELPLSSRYLELVVTGRKSSTVRDGVLVFSPDCELQLRFSRTTPPLPVRITDYRVKRFRDVSQQEVERDGFTKRDDLLTELQRYYPGIADESIVTVIDFAMIESSCVDRKARTGAGRRKL